MESNTWLTCLQQKTEMYSHEYLGDIKLERALALLENLNRDYNSTSLILDQFRDVPCLVTAEFSHTVIPPRKGQQTLSSFASKLLETRLSSG